MKDTGEPVRSSELDDIRADIEAIVDKLDRMIGDRGGSKTEPVQS